MIQRPAEATSLLVFRYPAPAPPSSPLTVGPKEVVAISRDGVVLGVVPPGTYRLDPQSLPFIGQGGALELWFVTTTPYYGVQFGGSIGGVVDPVTQVLCAPRGFGDFALLVRDPATVVRGIMGMSADSSDGLLAWFKGIVLNHVKTALATVVAEGKSVVARDLGTMVAARAASGLATNADLAQTGIAFVQFGAVNVTLSEDEIAKLRAAQPSPKHTLQGATPMAGLRCPQCQTVIEGGRFCGACGAPLSS